MLKFSLQDWVLVWLNEYISGFERPTVLWSTYRCSPSNCLFYEGIPLIFGTDCVLGLWVIYFMLFIGIKSVYLISLGWEFPIWNLGVSCCARLCKVVCVCACMSECVLIYIFLLVHLSNFSACACVPMIVSGLVCVSVGRVVCMSLYLLLVCVSLRCRLRPLVAFNGLSLGAIKIFAT